MIDNLVIVESPAKAKTIEKYLGKKYHVISSLGHIRDLKKKNAGIDIDNNFKPDYEIPEEKEKTVATLRKAAREAKEIWVASDEDREGEAIAWHLTEVLNLDINSTKRIVFHEITKSAIEEAIKNPRTINMDLVNSQQARRVLDRLVGFEVSPVLWKKVKPSLSAGRVQSVAVRLIVEREREIIAFKSESSFRVVAHLIIPEVGNSVIKAEAVTKFKSEEEARAFLEMCANAQYSIAAVTVKPATRTPSAPFTTSTLQQEAYRKLGMSVSQTMTTAQHLYEAGLITYMRTDSTNLSKLALSAVKGEIVARFGEEYSKPRQYKTKAKGAQEAHEAIRPTYIANAEIKGTQSEKRLYNLIWKRTIASQMADAEVEKTTISIAMNNSPILFTAIGEVVKFDGFIKLYSESTDHETDDEKGILPTVSVGMGLEYNEIVASQRFTSPLPRYTEASLVKKLEELGIGRPSTYAPTISTIQHREYVQREDRMGEMRNSIQLTLGKKGTIERSMKSEIAGKEKSKLFPQNIGMMVNDFLVANFPQIVDYHFTATVEEQFDSIAIGELAWTDMLKEFYGQFHQTVETALGKQYKSFGSRCLGIDPASGEKVIVKVGHYGPVAQIGETEENKKPRFTALNKGQLIETITLEEALKLFELPRNLGLYEDEDVIIGKGRFGPYVRHNGKFTSLKKDKDDPYSITLERAIELIEESREAERKKNINDFGDIKVLNGRYGPYISKDKVNYKIPKELKAEELTKEDCLAIIDKSKK